LNEVLIGVHAISEKAQQITSQWEIISSINRIKRILGGKYCVLYLVYLI